MRHRRRVHTQTVRKRKNRTQTSPAFQRSPKSIPKFPFVLLAIAVLAAAAWYYSDSIMAFADSILPSSGAVSESANQPVAESSVPKIPSESTKAQASDDGSGQNPIPAQQYSPIERRIQLEILNGCGEKGIAGKLASILKDSRYDIVNSGNYMERGSINWDVKETRIIDQVGKVENARDLADVMGVLYSNVESYNNPSPIADITIIIGEDYKTLPIFQ